MRAFLFVFFLMTSAVAVADDTIFACQEMQEIGYIWRNNSWFPNNFPGNGKFFIQFKDGKIQAESISSAISGLNSTCKETFFGYITCQSGTMTNTMLFDSTTGKGSVARQLGSVMGDASQKDSVSITLFSCQKMQ